MACNQFIALGWLLSLGNSQPDAIIVWQICDFLAAFGANEIRWVVLHHLFTVSDLLFKTLSRVKANLNDGCVTWCNRQFPVCFLFDKRRKKETGVGFFTYWHDLIDSSQKWRYVTFITCTTLNVSLTKREIKNLQTNAIAKKDLCRWWWRPKPAMQFSRNVTSAICLTSLNVASPAS